MKRSEELKIKRREKIDAMQALVDKATNENKRSLTDEEQTSYDGLKTEVDALERQITDAEYLESRQNTTDQNVRSVNFEYKRKAEPYSAGKAIREYISGGLSVEKLTGIEKERHDELSREIQTEGLLIPSSRDQNTTSGADSIDVKIDPNVSIIGKAPLYRSMGLTIIEGLTGAFKLPVKTPDVAAKYAEKAEITQTGNEPTFVDMAPERYGITDIFTKELLVQRNPAVQAAILRDMEAGVDRKLTADVYAVALAAATAVAAGALTVAGFNALMAAVDIEGAFAMTRSTFFEAKGEKIDAGSGKFLAQMGAANGIGTTNDGVPVFYSTLFADGTKQKYIIYGAWAEMWMGMWGATEVLINPFTYQKKGQIEMTTNKLAKIVNRNSAAFVKSPDLDATT